MSFSEQIGEPSRIGRHLTFVTHEYPPTRGGAATVVAESAAAARSLGWDARVLAAGRPQDGDADSPVPILRMGHRGRQDRFARAALLRFLAGYRRRDDEHIVFADPGATRAALAAPLPVTAHPGGYSVILHGSEIPLFDRRSLRGRFRRLLGGATRVHLLSEANRRLLLDGSPHLAAPLVVAAGAPSRWAVRATGRTERCADPDRLTILTVGRIHPRKGQYETLAALKGLPDPLQKKIRYRVVGPTVRRSYRRKVERLAADCPFPVEFAGAIGETALAAEYAAADLFALCSQPLPRSIEGFGLVYLDASAAGLPIVANRIGGVAEAVLDGETGLLADPADPATLSAAFRRLLEDGRLRLSLGETGRQRARSMLWTDTIRAVWGAAPAGS